MQIENIFKTCFRNAPRFKKLYLQAEKLFQKLEDLRKQWMHWIVLGSIDVLNLAQQYLHTADDWNINFQHSKTLAQQIAKLPRC